MKLFLSICLFLGLLPWAAHAQVDFSCRLEQSRTILYESVMLRVRLQNNTGRPLRLHGANADAEIRFEIERQPGRTMRQTRFPLFEEEVVLAPREVWTGRIDLTDVYDMRDVGPYTIRPRVDVRGEALVSNSLFLDVVPGLEVAVVRAPPAPDAEGVRHYRLMTVNRDRGEHLFLRVDDVDAGICYAVRYLGRVIRARKPELDVDGDLNVNVLHQTAPGRFVHHVYNSNGRQVFRRLYSGTVAQVRFGSTEDGRIIVLGGTTSLLEEPE